MKISKKKLRDISKGNFSALMQCIEFLIDHYNEDKFDLGYQSCLDDMGVMAQRIAEELHKKALIKGEKIVHKNDDYALLTIDETAEIIEEYIKKTLYDQKEK